MLKRLKNAFIPSLVCFLLIFNSSMASTATAAEKDTLDPEDKPQVWLAPEKEMQGQKKKDERSWLSRNKWWAIIGIVILGGIGGAVAASGGGDDGGGQNDDGGSYVNNW